MKYIPAFLIAAGLMYGASDLALAEPKTVNFDVTDIPGYWFDTGSTLPGGTRSLHIINPGDTVTFTQNSATSGRTSESLHTVTSLIFPAAAVDSEKLAQPAANDANHHVILKTPGLYVFVCKVHPYMLGGVIVDDPKTTTVNEKGETVPAYDIGNAKGGEKDLHLEGVGDFPSNSNLGLRLLRAFFVVTSPSNWKDYTKVGLPYKPAYPPVPVALTGGAVVPDLNAALQATFDGDIIPAPKKPRVKGVGEVWVDSQYELTDRKGPKFPGTISVVEVGSFFPDRNWKVKRKIALPHQKMNNGHNMWASHDQRQIYQTEWHGASLFVIDRLTGHFMQEIKVGEDPAHVMTRVDTRQVHVSLNGEDGVMELNRNRWGFLTPHRVISMQDPDPNKKSDPTQPHAHWMGFDGKTMATPNANTADSSLFDFEKDEVVSKLFTGGLPIAAAMMPDSSKYYVSNYLSHTTSVIDMKANPPVKIKDINLLQNYDPITGAVGGNGAIGGLPIQTPVSPDGKFVVTGNTLTGTITIIDTKTDTLVKSLTCDPGCHGVNFGAKHGGGYYAYVTSKFANRLIVLDYDPNNDGKVDDAVIAGWVVLDNDNVPKDDAITKVEGNRGQGGQGVLPVPNVYNGWVQELPIIWKIQLTHKQRHPFPQAENNYAEDRD
jgi:DNA-binding beta-propeller fold protein YncE